MTNLHFGILVVLICLGNLASASFSNEGTEFYVGFMDNDYGDGRDMYLYMTTGSNTPAEVTVTAPKQDTNFRKTAQVARGQSVRVSIPANFKATGSQVESKGIHVMSTQPISLYGLNQEQGSGDAFTAIPVTGLGSKYSAITWSNQGQILVVSTQDRTEVTVKLPGRANNAITYNGVTHTNYAEFTVTMSRYQTLHLQSDDLTATQIVANSAIAVFSGSKKVQIEGTMTSDHLVQQLTPYDAWGKEFLISAPPNSQKYKVKIVSQDRHPNIGRVYISGEGASGTFVTEFYTFVRNYQSDVLRRVWSDSPIQVALFTQSMDSSTNMIDASMVLVPPVYQYRSRYTFTTLGQTAAEMSSHMTIYVANVTTNAGTLRMDGQPMNVSFTKVASTDYYLGTMPVSPGAHEVYSTDPLTNFYGLISGFHASSNGNYYVTYPAGMNVAKNTLGCSPFVGQNIVAGNQVDEDCDGRVDEEIKNNIDDDGDGKVDEDLSLPSRANGNWGSWGSWEACSVTCENGTKSRRRLCNNPEPINGGLACPTDIQGDTDTMPCSLQRCPECDPAAAVSCTSKPNTVCSANRFCECEPGYRDTTGLGLCVKRKIGDTCVLSTDCNTVVGNSRCVEGRCVCSVGYKPGPDNTACVQLTIGDACTSTDQCDVVMDHVTCGTGNTCQCNLGYIATSGQSQCRKRVVGDSCSTDGDCSTAVTGTTCSTSTRRCTCAIGYRPSTDSTSCLARVIGDTCQLDEDCSTIPQSQCQSGTCQCDDVFLASGSTCRPRLIGDTCSSSSNGNEQCNASVSNSVCFQSRCKCELGYYPSTDSTTCRKRTIGTATSCIVQEDCTAAIPNSRCDEGVCNCNDGFYSPTGNSCIKRMIGDTCQMDLDCSTVIPFGVCLRGRCSCPSTHITFSDLTGCRIRLIGDSCSDTNQCETAIRNSSCVNSVCQCDLGYTASHDNSTCNKRTIGVHSCSADTDCLSAVRWSVCRENVCKCSDGYVSTNDGSACTMRKIGDQCQNALDCSLIRESVCGTSNNCQCNLGFTATENRTACRQLQIGDPCTNQQHCETSILNGECHRHLSVCACPLGYHAETLNRCVKRKIGDATCNRSVDCSEAVEGSMCKEGICACMSGYKASADMTTCRKRMIGDNCTSVADCTSYMEHSECVEGKCACNPQYLPTEDRSNCRTRVLGDPCELAQSNTAQCNMSVSHSICENLVCVCEPGYSKSVDGRACIKDGPCSTNTDCNAVLLNSFCFNGGCICTDGYKRMALPSGEEFCQSRPLNDPCQSTGECSAILPAGSSECKLDTDGIKRCFCSDSHREFNSTQCRRAKINDICETPRSTTMCTDPIPFSECSASSCVCKAGYMASPDLASCTKRAVGSPCSTNNDCQAVVVDSLCSDGTCSCKQGYKYISTESACRKRQMDDACSIPEDCSASVASSTCSNGKCACISGYVQESKSKCRIIHIDDNCTVNADCSAVSGEAECKAQGTKNMCKCKDGYYPSDYNLLACAQRQVGDKNCDKPADCSQVIPHSTCYNNECVCVAGYRSTLDGKGCRNTLENWEIALIAAACAFVCFAILCFLLGWCGRKRIRRRHSMKQFTGAWHSSIEDLRVSSAASDSTFNKEDMKSWPADGMTERERVETMSNPVYETSEIKPSDVGLEF